MRLGIHFANFSFPGGDQSIVPHLVATAKAADEGGCDTFTVMDHWFQLESFAAATEPMLEGYTTLGFLAGQTTQIKLGLLVTGVTYRHPGLLAKTVTTLDVLSGGRATLGLGAAWYEREHKALGVPFPPIAERFERLEETLEICHQMWSDHDGHFHGKHFRLEETICSPMPVQKPRPRIVVGGGGEKKTLRLVAAYADACNLFASSPPEIAHKLDVLRGHCEAEDRDPSEIEATILAFGNPLDDVDAFLASMEGYANVGVKMVDIMPFGPDPAALVNGLCEQVVPRLAEIG